MEDCLFCKIIEGKIPAQVVYQDDFTIGVLDILPRSVGHTMVIPKKHAETILELDDNEVAEVFKSVKKVVQLLKEKIKPDGFTIGINHGKVSGQAIDHLHIHIIPRFIGDKGGSIHSVVSNPPEKSLQEVRDIIIK